MFYRVDYLLTVMAVGFVAGATFSRATEAMPAPRLAGIYYFATALLVVLRTAAFAWTTLANPSGLVTTAGSVIGDLLSLLFVAAFGLAMRRQDARVFLTDSSLLGAFYLVLAFTFALAGVGKAFSMTPMTEFFTQSGYSVGFLKFIVLAEIFGALGLLLPWARIPAWFGLTVDMFGAVLTHLHNGDPLNDSTGAIGMLIRLVAVAIVFGLQRREHETQPRVSSAAFRTAAAAIVCFCIAIGGSVVVRHLIPSSPAAPSGTK